MAGKTLRTVMLAGLIVAVPVAGIVFAHGGGSADQNQAYGSAGGMGSGMMGGQGMGPGMMGGQGMGPGMMGGQGMGPGMMGGAQMNDLGFTADQRKQLARIQTGLRKQHWALQGKMIDAQGKLAELYAEDTLDPKKIGAAYGELFDLRRQMIEAAITAQNRQRDVLTAEQRKQLREKGYGSGRGHGMGMGMMQRGFGHHMMGG